MSMNVVRLDRTLTVNKSLMEAPNLCDRLSTEDLTTIGMAVFEGYDRDEQSRLPWMRRSNAGMDLAMQISKSKNFPWPGCSNVVFPLVTIATLQFHSRA